MRPQNMIVVLAVAVASFAGQVQSQEPVNVPPVPSVAAPSSTVPQAAQMPHVIYGEPSCCARCATACQCQKHTRIVCEMKKVKKTSWTTECEDVCSLLPSSMLPDSLFGISLFGHKKLGCGEVGCADCAQGCCDKAPIAGHCRTRKVLVQKTTTIEVPVYKCVVEYCCQGCGSAIDAAPEAPAQQAALPDANVHRMAGLPRDRSGYGE
ncbi:hypothetical protein DTL21_10735 [Bremerella cremea]|uniref:Uncharacterized protein n=1 Tax=Blastopirellula marina TaxID=124 RepID=A0A2S8FX00_9BACT|nr:MULTISPECIES: hypothetical protein [Pirellulaceae]PQO36364.1 hypothetical protein C5Y83_10730 [Blastopirellula marina]RCS49042.1 hypothetical protein DTL21_10735 [Bremerella cremea]